MCKYFLEPMVEQKSGTILNIGSIQACNGPNFPVYGNTGMTSPVFYTYEKWGVVGLDEIHRQRLRQNTTSAATASAPADITPTSPPNSWRITTV